MAWQIFSSILVVAVLLEAALAAEEPVVKTSLGAVKGKQRKSYEGRNFTAFEGIPFAKPPVGDLRFKEPQPAEPWNGTLEGNKTYVCTQYTIVTPMKDAIGDEDCLYLYVYVPRTTIKEDEHLPVIFYIHEGGFTAGDPKTAAAPEYFMDRDVIFVTANYRLGVLGFLSTLDEVSPGNYGLKDQSLAMRWTKNNIRSFGGNPDSITLVGSSAGAASVHYHYVSPLSVGLFNRGYSQSGTIVNSWARTKNPVGNARKLADSLGCKNETSKAMVECLRELPAKDVVAATGELYTLVNFLPDTPFGPSIEPLLPGAFLIDHPYKLLLEGHVQDLPWVTSNTKQEGIIPVGLFILFEELDQIDKNWTQLAPILFNYNDTANEGDKAVIGKLIRQFYLKNESVSMDNVQDLIKLFTDRAFFIDALKAVCLQATTKIAPVYYFLFDYHTDIDVFYKPNVKAVGHGDDTRLLVPHLDNPEKLSDSDRRMKDILMDFLYSYASRGLPEMKGGPWFPIYSTPEPFTYMHIYSPDNIKPESYLDLTPFIFWHHLPIAENEHLFQSALRPLEFLPIF